MDAPENIYFLLIQFQDLSSENFELNHTLTSMATERSLLLIYFEWVSGGSIAINFQENHLKMTM